MNQCDPGLPRFDECNFAAGGKYNKNADHVCHRARNSNTESRVGQRRGSLKQLVRVLPRENKVSRSTM